MREFGFAFTSQNKKDAFELHCHTTYSDGSLTPQEIVDLAVESNVKMLAITDHDTIEGVKEAREYIDKNNIDINLINGIELTAKDYMGLHILGYGLKDLDKVDEFVKHYEKECEKNHQIPKFPSAKECINLIREAGGISVIAHPFELMFYNRELNYEDKVIELIMNLKNEGLQGVECCTYKHTLEQQEMLIYTCDDLGMVKTLGNDFHNIYSHNFGSSDYDIIKDFNLALGESDFVME